MENNKSELSKKEKFWGSIVGVCITALLRFFIVGGIVGGLSIYATILLRGHSLSEIAHPGISVLARTDFAVFLASHYISLAIACFIFILFLIRRHKDIAIMLKPGYKNNNLKTFLIGCLAGFVFNTIGLAVAMLHGDITLKYVGMNIGLALISLVCVTGQCVAEEVVYRAFVYGMICKRHPVYVAVLISAFLFALTHASNDGVGTLALLNIFLIGILFAESVFYFDTIFIAFGFHTLWNYTQNFIYGLPNSGLPAFYSFFGIDYQTDSPFYSTAFGIESTMTSTIIISIAIVVITIIGNKRKNIFKTSS